MGRMGFVDDDNWLKVVGFVGVIGWCRGVYWTLVEEVAIDVLNGLRDIEV